METTSGSEYRPEGSGSKDSGSGSESVDTELEFPDECVGTVDKEDNGRGTSSTVYLYILWLQFYNLLLRSQSFTNACILAMHVLYCLNLPYNLIHEQWHPGIIDEIIKGYLQGASSQFIL